METDNAKSETKPLKVSMLQGPGFFGVRGTDTKIFGSFANVEVKPLEFDSTDGSDIKWPDDGSTRVERLIFLLQVGAYGSTTQAFTNILSDTSEIATMIGFDRSSRGNSLVRVMLRDISDEIFPLKRQSLDSGSVGKDGVNRKTIYFYEIDGKKGNALAKAVAISEAHQVLWRRYKLPLNKFIKNGEFARRGVVGENNPYQIIQALAKLDKPGEYLVREVFDLGKGWDSHVFDVLVQMATQIKFSADRDPDSTEAIFDYTASEEGFIVINERHLKEFQTLQDTGYYDNEQNCQIVLASKEYFPDGTLNKKRAILKAIDELQSSRSLSIPISDIESLVRSRNETDFKEISTPRFRELIYDVLIRKTIGSIGRFADNKVVLNKRIVVLEDVPLQRYSFLPDENRQIHQALLFRKKIIEKWLSKEGKDMRIPVSEAREIYRKMMEDLGITFSTQVELYWKAKSVEYSFVSIPTTGPRIKINAYQLKRIKDIATVLTNVPERYAYLAKNSEGQKYIRDIFEGDLDQAGDRIGPREIPNLRLGLITTLLEELEEFFNSIDEKAKKENT